MSREYITEREMRELTDGRSVEGLDFADFIADVLTADNPAD